MVRLAEELEEARLFDEDGWASGLPREAALRIEKLEALVDRARCVLPTHFVNWHADANKALKEK